MAGLAQTLNYNNSDSLGSKPSAQKQTEQNYQDWNATTQANRPNVQGVYGGQQWTTDPRTGAPVLSTQLNGMAGQAAGSLEGQYADLLRQGPVTGDAARQQAIDSAYGQATSRLDPQWQKREEAQRTQLLNQGLTPDSEAYKSAMGELGQQRNDAYTSAMNAAIGQGTAAGDSVFRNNIQARESLLGQMGGMQQLTEAPRFNAAGQRQGADWVAASNADLDRGQRFVDRQMDALDNGVNNLVKLTGKSDARFKKRIRRLEKEAMPGVRFATWEWKDDGSQGFGVIAQDLEKVAPQYVHRDARGMRWVDYSFLGAR